MVEKFLSLKNWNGRVKNGTFLANSKNLVIFIDFMVVWAFGPEVSGVLVSVVKDRAKGFEFLKTEGEPRITN